MTPCKLDDICYKSSCSSETDSDLFVVLNYFIHLAGNDIANVQVLSDIWKGDGGSPKGGSYCQIRQRAFQQKVHLQKTFNRYIRLSNSQE